MPGQAKLLDMNEDRYKMACPFHGEKDYAFTFEFIAVNAIWQVRDAESASLVARPNIWMGEDKEDHFTLEQRPGGADERLFAYRLGRSFALVCLNDRLYLTLSLWEENQEGQVSAASLRNNSVVKVATRMRSGKAETLLFSPQDPCLVKLETRDGLSTVKVWNTEETGAAPYILGDFGAPFRDFFSGFSEFQFNAIPQAIKTRQHSLRLERVAAWLGNSQPEAEENLRDYLAARKQQLKGFAYRQLPLERLRAYYPLQKNRWATLDSDLFHCLENAHFAIDTTQGLRFDAFRNKCTLCLAPTMDQGVSASFILNVSLKEARFLEIQTVTALLDTWSTSQAVFSRRKCGLDFKRILEDVERFDPALPFACGAHYQDRRLVETIKGSSLASKLANFVGQLAISDFADEAQLKATMGQLQAQLNEDKKTLYSRRADIGVLTCRTSAPERRILFKVQVLRRMQVDSASGELRYEERMLFKDEQGNDRGSIDLRVSPCFLLLCLSDDRKAFTLYSAGSASDLSLALAASLTQAIAPTAGHMQSDTAQTLDEVMLTLGVGAGVEHGPMLSIKDLTLWDIALWRREGVLAGGNCIDRDYNVKTLAHLSFSGLLAPLVEQYGKSSRD